MTALDQRPTEPGPGPRWAQEPSLRLDQLLAWRAEHWPDDVALESWRRADRPRYLTWSQFDQAVSARAGELSSVGPPGTPCAVVLADTVECLEVVFALWRAGLVLVPVDQRWGRGLHDDIVAMSGATAVVACEADVTVRRTNRPRPSTLDPEVALISYTSGSTSDPKGVVLRHRHLRAVYAAGVRALLDMDVEAPQRYGCSMRLSGLGVMGVHYLFALEWGAATVVLPELSMANAGDYWDDITAHRIDMTYWVPALLETILRRTPPPGRSGRRLVALCGGAPMRAAAQVALQDSFPCLLLNAYGATEMGFAVFFGDRGPDGRGTHSVGVPALGEGRLRADDGTIVGGEGTGQLELRGPSMADGYWANEPATREAFGSGWYHTGDILHRDAEGRYFHWGRQKDTVMRGSFTIYLTEVEDALLAFDGVVDAAAVRLREGEVSEDVGAIVQVPCGSSVVPGAVVEHCWAYLGRQRSPRRVFVTTAPIPRVAAGKVDRRGVKGLWEELTARSQTHPVQPNSVQPNSVLGGNP